MSVDPQPCEPDVPTELGFFGPDEAHASITTIDDGTTRTVLIESSTTDGEGTLANGNVNMTLLTYEGIGSFFNLNVGGGSVLAAQRTSTTVDIRVGTALPSTRLGFLGASPVTRPAVTGSRGGNAALASLLTALANLGLITNSTSA